MSSLDKSADHLGRPYVTVYPPYPFFRCQNNYYRSPSRFTKAAVNQSIKFSGKHESTESVLEISLGHSFSTPFFLLFFLSCETRSQRSCITFTLKARDGLLHFSPVDYVYYSTSPGASLFDEGDSTTLGLSSSRVVLP